jgi:hypothetical protein
MCNIPPSNGCPITKRDTISQLDADADRARTLGVIGLAVGAASAATGVVLLVLSGTSESKTASIRPWIGLHQAGVVGRF